MRVKNNKTIEFPMGVIPWGTIFMYINYELVVELLASYSYIESEEYFDA